MNSGCFKQQRKSLTGSEGGKPRGPRDATESDSERSQDQGKTGGRGTTVDNSPSAI